MDSGVCGWISSGGGVWKVEEWEGSGAAHAGDGVVGCGGCGVGERLYIGIAWYRIAITLFQLRMKLRYILCLIFERR